jgi:hypothetical protein
MTATTAMVQPLRGGSVQARLCARTASVGSNAFHGVASPSLPSGATALGTDDAIKSVVSQLFVSTGWRLTLLCLYVSVDVYEPNNTGHLNYLLPYLAKHWE